MVKLDLMVMEFFGVLCDCLWSNAHLCRLERLQTISHSPLEDLLRLFFVLVDVNVAPAISMPVLGRGKTHGREEFIRP